MSFDLNGFIEKAGPLRAISVLVSQHGRLIGEHHWDDQSRRNIYSASKSVTSAAVGIAQGEGLLRIDEKLTDVFADELPETVSDNLQKATVRDLLTMCLGQPQGLLMGAQRPYLKETDWVRWSLAQPFEYAPGERFVYSNVGPYLAAVLVQRRAGCDLVSYLMPRLFGPLGIMRPSWETDANGFSFGASGLCLNADELHRFGQLYLQNGQWNGQQLIPADWVHESTVKQVENGTPYGYGYLFWGGPDDIFRADGKYGQFTFLMRRKDAVVTVLAESREAAALQSAVYSDIYALLEA